MSCSVSVSVEQKGSVSKYVLNKLMGSTSLLCERIENIISEADMLRSKGHNITNEWIDDNIRIAIFYHLRDVFSNGKVRFRVNKVGVFETFEVRFKNRIYKYHIDVVRDSSIKYGFKLIVYKERIPRFLIIDERVSSGYHAYVLYLYDRYTGRIIDSEEYGDLSYWGIPNEYKPYDEAITKLLNRNDIGDEKYEVMSCGGWFQDACEDI
ncbi:MAG: hypothetical protein QW521_03620 [Desulfurococcaceae archaeon]